jgi:hypothetical protein
MEWSLAELMRHGRLARAVVCGHACTMVRSPLVLGTVALCAMLTAARAEEMSSSVDTRTEDGVTTSVVNFEFESCGGECQVAMLTCSNGSITLDLADVDAKHAAKAIVQETNQVLVTAGKFSIGYDIREMRFQEMTGSWWMSAGNNGVDGVKLAGAIAKAKTVVAKVGGQTVTLPIDAKVKAWALACK